MSTLSEAGKLLKTSENESKFNLKAVASVVVGGILIFVFGNILLGNDGGVAARLAEAEMAKRAMPSPTVPEPIPTMHIVALPTEEPTPTAWPTPIIIYQEVEATREIPAQPIYVEVPGPVVEVTRIVEVAAPILPTVTPIPLAPGTVQICVNLEGAKAVYIGNEGVVSGGCKLYTFGVGQTTILVQVDK